MKFRVTLKDPDGVYDSLDDAAKESAREVACFHFDNMKCRGRITFSGDQGLHLLTKAIFAGVIGLFGGMP